MTTDLETAKTEFINQWAHCPAKRLSACNALIACECGQTWPWESTLGATMEWLELMEEVRKAAGPAPVKEQPTLFG